MTLRQAQDERGCVAFAGSPGTAGEAADIRARVDVAACDAWVARAQPGCRKIYGMGAGVSVDVPAAVAGRVRALAEAGLVEIFHIRVPRADGDAAHPFDFLMIRTARALPPGWPALPRVEAPKRVVVVKVAGRR